METQRTRKEHVNGPGSPWAPEKNTFPGLAGMTVLPETLRLAVLSLVLALISALFTFTGLLGDATGLGRVAFIAFLTIFIITAAITALKRDSSL